MQEAAMASAAQQLRISSGYTLLGTYYDNFDVGTHILPSY